MYLYVFVFIILAVISMYMELFSMRISRINEQQTSVAGIMRIWHNGAHRYAVEHYGQSQSGSPCRLTDLNQISPQPAPCRNLSDNNIAAFNHESEGGIQYLPTGFNRAEVKKNFPTYVHKDGNTTFVITYVLDGQTAFGISAGQVMSQIKRLDWPGTTYGYVRGTNCAGATGGAHSFWTKGLTVNGAGGDVCFEIPDDYPASSVGIISYL